jgi:hypothetical protein
MRVDAGNMVFADRARQLGWTVVEVIDEAAAEAPVLS